MNKNIIVDLGWSVVGVIGFVSIIYIISNTNTVNPSWGTIGLIVSAVVVFMGIGHFVMKIFDRDTFGL